jgi:hypothetical protein
MLEDINIQKRLSAIADRVEHDVKDLEASSRLRDLRDALDPGQSSHWVYADIFKVIDADTIAAEATKQTRTDRVVGILEWIRNGFVLLPLILTWFGIADAVSHYYAYVKTDEKNLTLEPFLKLWEGGFGGAVWLTLSRLALFDFVLLLLLLILTVIVHGRANVTAMRKERLEQELKQEISHALSDASLALARKREQQKDPQTLLEQFEVAASQLIGQLAAQREDQNRFSEMQKDEVNSLSLFTPSLEKSTQEMVRAAETMRAAQEEHAQIVSDSLQAMRDGQTTLTAATREAQQTITAAMMGSQQTITDAMMQSQQTMSQELQQAQQAFVGATRSSTQQAVEAVQHAQQELLISMRQLHQEMVSGIRQSQSDLVERVGQSQQTVLNSVARSQESLHASIQELATPMQSFAEQQGQLLASNQEATRQLNIISTEQRQWSGQLQTAMQSITGAAESLQTNTGRSLEIAQQIADIASGIVEAQRRLEEVQAQFLTEIAQERAEQKELARVISQSNTGVEGAVSGVRQTSQILHGIAVDLYELARSWPGTNNGDGGSPR